MPRPLITACSLSLCWVLVGCASLISQAALKAPQLRLDLLTPERQEVLGYSREQYCKPTEPDLCLSYLSAEAHTVESITAWQDYLRQRNGDEPLQTRAMEVSLKYWPVWGQGLDLGYRLKLDTVGQRDDLKLVLRDPKLATEANPYVLIHGFRTNKESLLFVAEALRYAGHEVFIFDLLGHGESTGQFSLSGEPDAELISQFMTTQGSEQWHLLGMSMGGTTATHLARQRDDVSTLTLLAPMLEFVDAFVDAGRAYTRSAHLVPQSYLADGANTALRKAGTERSATSVVRGVGSLQIPVLIMGSARDQISPWSDLQQLQSEHVTTYQVSDRSHHAMILWDTADFNRWRDWLEDF